LINPLNAELNPICHLLILLGDHHILHVSRRRVKYCDVLLVIGTQRHWCKICFAKTEYLTVCIHCSSCKLL